MYKIRVFVAGACGKMGSETVKTILSQDDMEIVGVSDIQNQGSDLSVRSEERRVG